VALIEDLKPANEAELASLITEAARSGIALDVSGSGTKRAIGRPTNTTYRLSTSSLRGITLYEPNEMVMSALAGTPLLDIQTTLAQHNQMLPFEPNDLGGALGVDTRYASIGAVFATNASGSRRLSAGAARDHLLGVRAVNGRGEIFKNGGRVMKNVTGYDISRGLCGSWGTLAVMSEVTFKVIPTRHRSPHHCHGHAL
jgi:glycolate oxidase FAD binding subunit